MRDAPAPAYSLAPPSGSSEYQNQNRNKKKLNQNQIIDIKKNDCISNAMTVPRDYITSGPESFVFDKNKILTISLN